MSEEAKRVIANWLVGCNGNPAARLAELDEAAESAMQEWAKENGWSEWGDGEWREDSACSICGSALPGICGHQKDPNQVVLRGIAAVEMYRLARQRAKGTPTP